MSPHLNLGLISLEFACAAFILIIFLVDIFTNSAKKPSLLPKFVFSGLVALFGWSLLLWGQRGIACYGMYTADAFSQMFKPVFILTAAVVTLMANEFMKKTVRGYAEFYLLIVTALFGMLLLASANDFVLMFVSIEVITISFYVMTAYLRTDDKSLEAGIKYLILGSLSTGLTLYGISFIYGTTASTNFDLVRSTLSGMGQYPLPLIFGLVLLLAGLCFKAGTAPFQVWIPDVYEGSPTPVTAYLSVGSKMAGFVILARVFFSAFEPVGKNWGLLLAILSALTLLYGNLGAIPQTNIKRFFGYSSIGHAGYLLMGLAAANLSGERALAFYLVAYAVTTLAAFLVVVYCSTHLASDSMDAYNGLAYRSPVLAATMLVALLSLAGVPPLAGFFAKFLILSSLIEKGFLWLAILGAVNVVVSLYYYLQIVRRMYITEPLGNQRLAVSVSYRVGLYAFMAAVIGIGVVQEPLLRIVSSAASALIP